MLADQYAEVTTGERRGKRLVVLLDRQPRVHADLADDPYKELAYGGGKLALVDSLGGRVAIVVRSDRRDHAGRGKTDTEQAALALGDHLELDRRFVEPGLELLELAQRRPLRLADGLPRGFDLEQPALAHHCGSLCDACSFLKLPFFRRNRTRSVVIDGLASCA